MLEVNIVHTELVQFKERSQRSEYVAQRFCDYLKNRIVDIGCFQAPLRKLLTDCEYTGVDVAGAPDIKLNLDSVEPLPFQDEEFDRTTLYLYFGSMLTKWFYKDAIKSVSTPK